MKLYHGTIILVVILSVFTQGCSNRHYPASPVTSSAAFPGVLERAQKDKKYIIMYSGVNIYSVVSAQTDKAKEHITVQLDKVDSTQLTESKSLNTVSNTTANSALPAFSKVYLYMKDSTSYTLDEPHTIPLANVSRIVL